MAATKHLIVGNGTIVCNPPRRGVLGYSHQIEIVTCERCRQILGARLDDFGRSVYAALVEMRVMNSEHVQSRKKYLSEAIERVRSLLVNATEKAGRSMQSVQNIGLISAFSDSSASVAAEAIRLPAWIAFNANIETIMRHASALDVAINDVERDLIIEFERDIKILRRLSATDRAIVPSKEA